MSVFIWGAVCGLNIALALQSVADRKWGLASVQAGVALCAVVTGLALRSGR